MYNVSFLGLKENIAYGHKAIAAVKKDFPDGFRSNTYYETFEQPVDKDTLNYYEELMETTRALIDFKKRLGIPSKQATKDNPYVTNIFGPNFFLPFTVAYLNSYKNTPTNTIT